MKILTTFASKRTAHLTTAVIICLLVPVKFATAGTLLNESNKSEWIEDAAEEITFPDTKGSSRAEANPHPDKFVRRERPEAKTLENDPLAGFTPAPGASKEENFLALLKLAKEQDNLENWGRAKEYYIAATINHGNYEITRQPLLDTYIRLERLCRMTGDKKRADEYCQQLIDAARWASMDSDSADYDSRTIAVQLLIADALASQEKFHEAEAVLAQMKKASKGDIAFYIQALVGERLARLRVQQDLGKTISEDVDKLANVVRIELKQKPDYLGAKSYLCILSAQACCANYEKRLDDAKALTKKCLDLMAMLKPSNQYRMFRTLGDRGTTYLLENDLPVAISYYNKALEEANRGTPLSMVYQSPIILELATCYAKVGKSDKAAELRKKAASANYR